MIAMKRWNLILPVIILLLLATAATRAFVTVRATHQRVQVWKQSYDPEVIVGRNVADITTRFGKPYGVDRNGDGLIRFVMYKGPAGHYLGITFAEGVATQVSFSVQ